MKQTLIWLNLQKDEIGNGLYNINDTFAEGLQLQISALYQSKVAKSSRLVSQIHMMAGQNVKR